MVFAGESNTDNIMYAYCSGDLKTKACAGVIACQPRPSSRKFLRINDPVYYYQDFYCTNYLEK